MKELLAAQQRFKSEEAKKSGEQEHISIAEFRKLMGQAQDSSEKQTDILENVDSTLKDEKVIQLSVQTEQAKTKAAAKEVADATVGKLEDIDKALVNTLGAELKKQSKTLDNILKYNEKTADKAKKALSEPVRKSFGEKVKDIASKFTPTGILRSIEKKAGTGLFGGIVGGIAGRAADIRERSKDIKFLDPELAKQLGSKGVKRLATEQIKGAETARRANVATETKIQKILERNPNLKESDLDKFAGGRELLAQREKNVSALEGTRIFSTAKRVKEGEKDKEETDSALSFSDEGQLESQRELSQQTELLQKIEFNTRKGEAAAEEPKKKEEEKKGGILDSITSLLSGKGALKNIGSKAVGMASTVGRGLLSVASSPVGLAVGAGLAGGYLGKKFVEHREKKEAANLAADEKTISENKIDVNVLKELPDEGSAWKPGDLKTVAKETNLAELRIKKGQKFTDEEAKLVKQKLGVDVPANLVGGAELQKAESAAPSTSKPAKTAQNIPAGRPGSPSWNFANRLSQVNEAPAAAQAPVVINAPVSNNSSSSQNITMPAPVRNRDSGLSHYIQKSAAFL